MRRNTNSTSNYHDLLFCDSFYYYCSFFFFFYFSYWLIIFNSNLILENLFFFSDIVVCPALKTGNKSVTDVPNQILGSVFDQEMQNVHLVLRVAGRGTLAYVIWALRPISLTVYEFINQNSYCSYFKKVMIRSGHNFAHVTTAQLPWHVQSYDLPGSLWSKLKNFILYFFFQDFS